MNPKHVFLYTLLFVWIITQGCNTDKSKFPVLKGPYFGQAPPGLTPQIFAKDIVSTDQVELNAVFSPDGNTFYFTRKNPDGKYFFFSTNDDLYWVDAKIIESLRIKSNI